MDNDDDIYPAKDGGRRRLNVPLTEPMHVDLELLAHVWTELDKARGLKGAPSWKATSVVQRMIEVGIASFYKQIGGRPDGEDEAEVVRRAVQKIIRRK